MTAVLNQIIDKLLFRLEAVAVSTEVVDPERLAQWTPRHHQVIVIVAEDDIEPSEEWSCHGNPPAQAWLVPVLLICSVKPSEKNAIAIRKERFEYAGEVIKAVSQPIDSWHNWDNLAVNSRWGTIGTHEGDRMTAARLELNIIYRTDENNPFIGR